MIAARFVVVQASAALGRRIARPRRWCVKRPDRCEDPTQRADVEFEVAGDSAHVGGQPLLGALQFAVAKDPKTEICYLSSELMFGWLKIRHCVSPLSPAVFGCHGALVSRTLE